jgi:hypothetical protein
MGSTIPWEFAGLLEPANYAVAFSGRGIDRNQIVVVQVHAQAPTTANKETISRGEIFGRAASPDASRPGLPTVQSPKENLSSARGW